MIVRILGEAQFDVADTEKSTLDNLEQQLPKLLRISRVHVLRGGSLVEVERPS